MNWFWDILTDTLAYLFVYLSLWPSNKEYCSANCWYSLEQIVFMHVIIAFICCLLSVSTTTHNGSIDIPVLKPILIYQYWNLSWYTSTETYLDILVLKPILIYQYWNLSWYTSTETYLDIPVLKPILIYQYWNLSWYTSTETYLAFILLTI